MISKSLILLRHQTQIAKMTMLVLSAQQIAKKAGATKAQQTTLTARQAILVHAQHDYGVAKIS
jgi:hypothetical protein